MLFRSGNFTRSHQNYSGLDLELMNLLPNYLIVLKEYIFMSKWILIGSLFLGIMWGWGSFMQSDKKETQVDKSISTYNGAKTSKYNWS